MQVIGHFPLPEFNQLIVAYAVETDGDVKLNKEIAEVKFLAPSQLASLDFGRLKLTQAIVAHWMKNA